MSWYYLNLCYTNDARIFIKEKRINKVNAVLASPCAFKSMLAKSSLCIQVHAYRKSLAAP
jgi:hypothetical protein